MKNEDSKPVEEAVKDTDRIEYYREYANAMLAAYTEDNVDVRGYFAWSTPWALDYQSRLC